jgi:hypothetical protein
MENREIRFRITEEMIMHLLKGKKIEYVLADMPRVVIEPPQGVITMTYEEFDKLKKMASIAEDSLEFYEFLKKIDELQSKIIKGQ